MIERLTSVAADYFAMRRTAGEQQRRPRSRVVSKDGEHATLILMLQVEEAVPCDNAPEPLSQGEGSHVPDEPLLFRKTAATHRNQRWRRIHPADIEALFDEVSCDRLAGPAAEIKDRSAVRQERCSDPTKAFRRQGRARDPHPSC